ncbi:uncharacterized protein LOC123890229 isoform X1 [Trifolium pratense]|uniref:uncharacterized protein LOC123890229 isoform X1 n=1 Tax=Trifolium pratense TaxID=57577 RepID=UPI001E69424B|nr:uncharacterized protein LOC123890229 isoform X1 [Trifolium pratense]
MEFDVTDATFEDDFIPTVISLINQDKFEVNDFDGAVNLETDVDTLLRNILDSTKDRAGEKISAQLAYLREIGRLSVDQLKDSIELFSDGSELKNVTRRETFLKM